MTYVDTVTTIEAIISQTQGDSDRFAETLRHQGIRHISFSQVAAVEACPQRYYLQYIRMLDPDPMPPYFTKGKLFHQALARSYQGQMNGQPVCEDDLCQAIDGECQGDSRLHLHNAVQVHLANRWVDYEVVAIEQPFVLQLDERLPPVVGVIDLILRHNADYAVIDHKTGHDFYAPDVLQMAVYAEYIRRTYGDPACEFYYDQYRCVRNLARIRKPAFERKQVSVHADLWQLSLARLRHGSAAIDTIRTTNSAPKSGECFRCPYRSICWD
jgi:hypothetical protein